MSNLDRRGLLQILKRELEFLRQGGYRAQTGWGVPLIFEDSPNCKRNVHSSCLTAGCALVGLAPAARRNQQAPCRHIRLNNSGVTVDLLYRKGTPEQLESVFREWLEKTIKGLEDDLQKAPN